LSADVVSALALYFVPDKHKALVEMKRVARPGGTVGFYAWDFAGGGLEFLGAFWNAAASLDPAAGELAPDKRFPFCARDGLTDLMKEAGLMQGKHSYLPIPLVIMRPPWSALAIASQRLRLP
jgi:hypothetical protein